jgi:hypothetical protein
MSVIICTLLSGSEVSIQYAKDEDGMDRSAISRMYGKLMTEFKRTCIDL